MNRLCIVFYFSLQEVLNEKELILLICILILFSCGCQKEDKYAKYTRIAVLSNEESNESKILFMDDDHEVIFQLETEFVDEAIHIDDKLYLGKDKNNYQAIDCVDVEFLDNVNVKEGTLLHYSENGSYVVYKDGKCIVFDKRQSKSDGSGISLPIWFVMIVFTWSITQFSILLQY